MSDERGNEHRDAKQGRGNVPGKRFTTATCPMRNPGSCSASARCGRSLPPPRSSSHRSCRFCRCRWRGCSRSALRRVAVAVLVGLALYDGYLIAPPFGVAALIPALLATVGIGLVIAGMTAPRARLRGDGERPSYVR
jgi:hypothetical protein